jgi:hypothetical protein
MELQRGMQRPFRLRKAYGATGRLDDGHRLLVTGARLAAPLDHKCQERRNCRNERIPITNY